MNRPRHSRAAAKRTSDWYDLFSRGARDWLRHNEKVREAVRDKLPEIIANADMLGGGRAAPCRCRCVAGALPLPPARRRTKSSGAGQGDVKPGDQLAQPGQQQGDGGRARAATTRAACSSLLEFKVDDIVDWLWEELQAAQPAGQDRRHRRTTTRRARAGAGAACARGSTAAAR